jgi:cysteine synthase A
VEPSFLPDVVDRMIAVADARSIAAARHLSAVLGRRCGPSTGTNLQACLDLIDEMRAAGQSGSIVTLLCDSGDRYASTCFDEGWREQRHFADADADPRLHTYLPAPAGAA